MRVLLVDDHALVREALAALLIANGVEVVGEVGKAEEGVAMALALKPDVVLMDLRMPEMDGLEALRRIKAEARGTKVVILSASDDPRDLYSALRSGASGFLQKDMRIDAFLEMLKQILSGDVPISPNIAAKILGNEGIHRSD